MRLRLDVLQATSLELKEILSKELEENPVIEDIIYPEDDVEPSGEKQDKKEETEEIKINDNKAHLEEINSEEYENVFPKDDFENKSGYEEEYNPEFAKIRDRKYNNTPAEEKKDLQSELKRQLDSLDIMHEDYAAAEILVSNIDSDGFLTEDIGTISLASGVQEATLNKMLEVIKTFEPAGVGARNVSESLMIQLRQKNQKRFAGLSNRGKIFRPFVKKRI